MSGVKAQRKQLFFLKSVTRYTMMHGPAVEDVAFHLMRVLSVSRDGAIRQYENVYTGSKFKTREPRDTFLIPTGAVGEHDLVATYKRRKFPASFDTFEEARDFARSFKLS